MQYPASKIRNVCLMGHGGDGKTSLAEALLFYTKCTDRMGKTADGNTVCDYDAEEIARKISIGTAVAPVEWNGYKINVLDTPGYFDFEGEVIQALSACEFAIIALSGKDGVNVGTEKAVKFCKKLGIPAMFYITKMDEENADFHKVYKQLKETFGTTVCAINAPIINNGKTVGYVDLTDMKGKRFENGKEIAVDVPASMSDLLDDFKAGFSEALAETSDEMMEKFFMEEPFTVDEIKQGLSTGIETHSIFPVSSGSAFQLLGIEPLLKFIVDYTPAPSCDESKPTALQVFKTVADPFVGKMSFFKVAAGKIASGMSLTNTANDTVEKIGKVYVVKGKTQKEVTELGAGDIGVVTKLTNTATGNLLAAAGSDIKPVVIDYPNPCLSMTVIPKAKGDEDKISQGLQRLAEEDLTFKYETNTETHEQIISGMGEMHLNVIVSKLKNKFNVDVDLAAPRIAYREAIRKKVSQRGRHKKQSGGHGQFGDVVIEFEPYDGEELVFEERVFGGAVPKNFFPAVEKGLRECAKKGVLAGYPMVGLKATLVDGSYHPVDSSEMSFKMAASIAYKEGLKLANPTILEPIGTLKVYIPDSMMGDIIGDINKRRGQIMGMTPAAEAGLQEVSAEVPMSEMATYAIDLRSMTRGRGYFTLDFARYQDAPANIAQQVIEESKANLEEEE